MEPRLTRFLLDADIVIYLTEGRRSVIDRLAVLAADKLGISALVHSQLVQQPALSARDREVIEIVIADIQVLPYDLAASISYGRLVAALGFNRKHAFDRMIAAHALALDAIMVTNNSKDFGAIEGLQIENWT